MSLMLSERDEQHIEKLRESIAFGGKITKCSKVRQGMVSGFVSIRVGSPTIVSDLIDNGVVPRKSMVLQPWDGPTELLRHWWRGLVDGNGWVGRANTRNSWKVGCCGSESVIRGLRKFLSERGIEGGALYEVNGVQGHWRLNFVGCQKPQEVAAVLYKDASVYLDRKMASAQELLSVVPSVKKVTSHLTMDVVSDLYQVHGTLSKVAGILGMKPGTLVMFCNRNGLYVRGKRDGSTAVLAVAG